MCVALFFDMKSQTEWKEENLAVHEYSSFCFLDIGAM